MKKTPLIALAAALASAALVSSVEYVPPTGPDTQTIAAPSVTCRARSCSPTP
jgi:hypothetical protein